MWPGMRSTTINYVAQKTGRIEPIETMDVSGYRIDESS